MQVPAAVILLVGVCHAGYIGPATLVRTPALDSAHIKSDRIGGNFAYSVKTAEAYAAVSPVVHHVPTPVGVSYHATPFHVPVIHAAPLFTYPAPVHTVPAVYPIHPFEPAVIAAAPVVPAPSPIIPYPPIAPAPVGPGPIAPVADVGPVPAPAPVESADDTVSVEAA